MTQSEYANECDRQVAGVYEAREADWRNGAVIYQVLVDRFAPSANLEAKRHLYPAPKKLHTWDEVPTRGEYLESERLWSHEIDFWGGDIASVRSRLEYIAGLGADVLYLNPIHLSYTNHRYDAFDYKQVAPEFGTRAEVSELADDVHARGMKLVLDGVFNHMGRNSDFFKSAESDVNSPYRGWFDFSEDYAGGARAWYLAENLPELVLENPDVAKYIWEGADSTVRGWLRDGVDGWRLDVAFDIGMRYLQEITNAAHLEKPGSLVVGEIANYPKEWFPSVDAVMNFTARRMILETLSGNISPKTSMQMFARMFSEGGYEHHLKSWLYVDNHDTERLAYMLPEVASQRLATLLQFTLPGSPNLYYGSELGMNGGGDPEMRAPMRWDWVNDQNETLTWHRKLIEMHNSHRALRVGDFRLVETEKLMGYERYTDRAADTVVVLINPTDETVSEQVLVANSKLMNGCFMIDQLTGERVTIWCGMLPVTLKPQSALVLVPETKPAGGYSSYKRVQ